MPYTIRFNHELKIVEIEVFGTMSTADLSECTYESISLQHKHNNCHVLVDATRFEDAPVAEVFELPDQYADRRAPISSRVGVVNPPSQVAQTVTRFYEDVCNNRGWAVSCFDTRDETVAWLTSCDPT